MYAAREEGPQSVSFTILYRNVFLLCPFLECPVSEVVLHNTMKHDILKYDI